MDPDTPPQGHSSTRRNWASLRSVSAGGALPSRAHPWHQLFPGRLSPPGTSRHGGGGERSPHTDQRGPQNPPVWLEPPHPPLLRSHPQ